MLIDGVTPAATAAPIDAEQVGEILRKASDKRCAIIPLGGGTMMELGAPLTRADLAVSLENLNRVLDHQAANLTVRAQAGITLAALNELLAAHGQYLPLDSPFLDRATIGGILAANASGSLRVHYGSARDLLLGLRVALADGQIVHGGGDVVKNVAGYDLPKLFVGSLGTLGIILEATFKIAPLPTKTSTLVAGFDQVDQACHVALHVLGSPLLPFGLEVLNPTASVQAGLGDRFTCCARFGGLASAVSQELREVDILARESGSVGSAVIDPDAELWVHLRDYIYEKPVLVKIGILPSQSGQFMAEAGKIADSQGLGCSAIAHAVGILLVAFEGATLGAAAAIASLRKAVTAQGGHLVVQRGPRELREHVDVWGPAPKGFGLMQQLKQELDPNGILNPGRFVGGI